MVYKRLFNNDRKPEFLRVRLSACQFSSVLGYSAESTAPADHESQEAKRGQSDGRGFRNDSEAQVIDVKRRDICAFGSPYVEALVLRWRCAPVYPWTIVCFRSAIGHYSRISIEVDVYRNWDPLV